MKKLYPGTAEAEKERGNGRPPEEAPDMIGTAPNYEKFKGWTPEAVLAWTNTD